MVCPERVRPAFCDTVTDIISGISQPVSRRSRSSAKMAALALRVSNTVSSRKASTPPSASPAACS